jgi:hypothetical protein
MRNFVARTAITTMFMAGAFTLSGAQAMTIAASAGLNAVTRETNLIENVSFYYRPYRHVYGPYYEYAYRPFWKYRIPSVYYRCGC